MTLNGVMAVIFRYFSEFGSFRGALRKSSHSLSHLLMSSCKNSNDEQWRRSSIIRRDVSGKRISDKEQGR